MVFSGKTINSIGTPELLFSQSGFSPAISVDTHAFSIGTDLMGMYYSDPPNHLAYALIAQIDGMGGITLGTPNLLTWNGNIIFRNSSALDGQNYIFGDFQLRFGVPTNQISVANLSGTDITIGNHAYPPVNYENINSNKNTCGLTSTLGLMGWGSYGTSTVKVFAATILGDTPTAGDAVDTTIPVFTNGGDYSNRLAYTLCFAAIDSANAVVVGSGGQACILNVSGVVVTANTPATFDNNCMVLGNSHVVDNFVIIPYLDTSFHLQVAVGSISGNTITFNAPVDSGLLSDTNHLWVDSALIDSSRIAIGTVKSTGAPTFKIISDS